MKKIILFLILIVVSAALFAQDSTGSGDGGVSGLPAWVYTAGAIVLALYELVIRFFPTAANYSIIGFVIAIIQKILPNKSSTGEKLP